MEYSETIEQLFNLLEQANMADSDQAQAWQLATDAGMAGAYGYIRQAIVEIAGYEIVNHWAATGERDYSLATRSAVTA